jgi:hypothetical protein
MADSSIGFSFDFPTCGVREDGAASRYSVCFGLKRAQFAVSEKFNEPDGTLWWRPRFMRHGGHKPPLNLGSVLAWHC